MRIRRRTRRRSAQSFKLVLLKVERECIVTLLGVCCQTHSCFLMSVPSTYKYTSFDKRWMQVVSKDDALQILVDVEGMIRSVNRTNGNEDTPYSSTSTRYGCVSMERTSTRM